MGELTGVGRWKEGGGGGKPGRVHEDVRLGRGVALTEVAQGITTKARQLLTYLRVWGEGVCVCVCV